MFICCFCQKECKNNLNSLRNHERLCALNPNKQKSNLDRKGIPAWNKGLTKDDPRVAKNGENVSKALKGKPTYKWTDEQRKARSEWRKNLHKEHPETHPNRRLAGNRNKMSYPEKVAFDFLTKMGIIFDHQKQVGKYFPDFIIDNVIIEIDGERWHDVEKDKVRDDFLTKAGYTVNRIKAKDRIEEKIKDILRMA